MKEAPSKLFIEPKNTQYARMFTSKYTQRIHFFRVHNVHQSEKVEWNKLVPAEIKARNMCWVSKGNYRAMPERQTKFSSPELIYNS